MSVIFYDLHRQIYTDGRALPGEFEYPAFLGYSAGHLDVEMAFDDPKMYTKPFTIKVPHDLQPDSDIFEMFCNENEKDRSHLGKQ